MAPEVSSPTAATFSPLSIESKSTFSGSAAAPTAGKASKSHGLILTGSPEQENPDALAYSRARTPFPRLGRPEDVAGAALYLASDDSGYVSGVNLLVDGGWMAY